MAGDKETGVCLMRMEEGLDSGPVYSELTTPIQESENFGALHDRLSQLAAELCRRDLIAVSQGSLTPKTQDQSLVTLAPKIDGEKCRIDWNKGADQIARLVRALSPAPAAFTYLDGARIKIFKAAVKSRLPQDRELPSGAVCHADSSSLEVCCGDENLSIEELQIEGRKRLPAAEFLKGSPLSRGQILR
ncbi:MAG: hypothetical protein DCC75_08270 [Proteobacteria bacterium]|nr:MAG: hypothetical protein DCC75_08270 [Pseudomonadota bacterium]